METYNLPDLIHLWETEGMTLEQMLGQILWHLQALLARLEALEDDKVTR